MRESASIEYGFEREDEFQNRRNLAKDYRPDGANDLGEGGFHRGKMASLDDQDSRLSVSADYGFMSAEQAVIHFSDDEYVGWTPKVDQGQNLNGVEDEMIIALKERAKARAEKKGYEASVERKRVERLEQFRTEYLKNFDPKRDKRIVKLIKDMNYDELEVFERRQVRLDLEHFIMTHYGHIDSWFSEEELREAFYVMDLDDLAELRDEIVEAMKKDQMFRRDEEVEIKMNVPSALDDEVGFWEENLPGSNNHQAMLKLQNFQNNPVNLDQPVSDSGRTVRRFETSRQQEQDMVDSHMDNGHVNWTRFIKKRGEISRRKARELKRAQEQAFLEDDVLQEILSFSRKAEVICRENDEQAIKLFQLAGTPLGQAKWSEVKGVDVEAYKRSLNPELYALMDKNAA